MLKFAWTAMTSFSTLPLKTSIWMGVIVMLIGVEEAVRALLAKLFDWYVVPGWTSLTVLVSLIGGTTLVSMGMLGEYVGKLYEQVKNRPLYIAAQIISADTVKKAEVAMHFEEVEKP
jgi:hypothetical protein